MNIFVVHKDPAIAVQWLDDKRCKHMVHETAEMLAMTFPELNKPYRETQYNHPVCKWVRRDDKTLGWTISYLTHLLKEIDHRGLPNIYYRSTGMWTNDIKGMLYQPVGNGTPLIMLAIQKPEDVDENKFFRNASKYKASKNTILAYRRTMIVKWSRQDKVTPVWTKRPIPEWYQDFLPQEQKAQLNLFNHNN